MNLNLLFSRRRKKISQICSVDHNMPLFVVKWARSGRRSCAKKLCSKNFLGNELFEYFLISLKLKDMLFLGTFFAFTITFPFG